MTDDPRFVLPADPTVKVGDRVNVRNPAGGFLANAAGQPMSWPVLSIGNVLVELGGKQHPDMQGNRWRTSVDACVVDMGARRRDLANHFSNALVEVPEPNPAVASFVFTEHMPNVVLADLVVRITDRGIPVEVTGERRRFVEASADRREPNVAARRREERLRQLRDAVSSPTPPAPGDGRPAPGLRP